MRDETDRCVPWGVPKAGETVGRRPTDWSLEGTLQSEVSSAVNMADSLTDPVCLKDFESYAREYLPYYAFEFFARGANEETTIRENLEALKRCENMGREQLGPGVKYRSHSTGQDYYYTGHCSIDKLTTQLPIDLIQHSVKRFGLGDTFKAIYLSISCCVTCTLTCRKVTCILDQLRLLICLFSYMLLELCVWWRGNWTSTVNY